MGRKRKEHTKKEDMPLKKSLNNYLLNNEPMKIEKREKVVKKENKMSQEEKLLKRYIGGLRADDLGKCPKKKSRKTWQNKIKFIKLYEIRRNILY